MVGANVSRSHLLQVLGQPDPLAPGLRGEQLVSLLRSARGGSGGNGVEAARRLGFDAAMLREASYTVVDHRQAVGLLAKRLAGEGVHVLPTTEALMELRDVREKAWSLINPAGDRYTAMTALLEEDGVVGGYTVYAEPGAKPSLPVYACMLISSRETVQVLHNLIVLGEGAEVTVVTGCAAADHVLGSLHVGVTEIYLEQGARLRYVMIHGWPQGVHVRARTAAQLGEEAELVSHYILHGSPDTLESKPRLYARGRKARVYNASIVVVDRGLVVSGAEVSLEAAGAVAELASRTVARGEARVEAPLRIEARAPQVKGHIECMGLTLSPKAAISSSPQLESWVEDAELTHEAAIGRLRSEELEYLQARGLDEATARRLILQGILHVEPPGLPRQVKALVEAAERMLAEKGAA